MKVLVDADALVALAKSDDSNHERAVKIAFRLKKARLFITPYTIPEAVTVLSYRVSQQAAIKFLKEVRKRRLFDIEVDVDLVQSADEVFISQKKKGTSWVDCFNVAVYKINNLDAIFSFDRFYKRVGLEVVP